MTQYKIIPSRVLQPLDYNYPINSLESKKALLLSMTPYIGEAETQRRHDANEVETFTRCKVGKEKNKSSNYEYTDIDTKMIISPQEYKHRYV